MDDKLSDLGEIPSPSQIPRAPSAVTVEVLSSGFCAKAPIPVEQAAALEAEAGVAEGTYYIELMRKKLHSIHDMQVRWMARVCNRKRPKHMQVQNTLRAFSDAVLQSFDSQFGPPNSALQNPPTRKYCKTKKKAL